MKIISESDVIYNNEHPGCSGCKGCLVTQLLEYTVTDHWVKKLNPVENFSSAVF